MLPLPHPHSCAPLIIEERAPHARRPGTTLCKQKEQRLREHEWVAYQKASAGRKRLSTLAHVHEDTKNVSVHGGGEREGATAGVVA